MTQIIKQDGSPVDDEPKVDEDEISAQTPVEDLKALAEDVQEGLDKATKAAKKFRDGFLFKVGIIAVAIKAIDVAGKIILENQRLKAEAKKADEQ